MAIIKSYTSLPQAEILSKILPLESADMVYVDGDYPSLKDGTLETGDIPCWSLAALLNVLPHYEICNNGDEIQLDVKRNALATEGTETLLDLVVNMIIDLHKQKLL